MRPIETIDVSRPPASTGVEKAASLVGNLLLAVLVTLLLPLGLMVLVSPVAALARVVLQFAGLI
jgi:hypothetical protein